MTVSVPADLLTVVDGDTRRLRIDRGWRDSSVKTVRLEAVTTPTMGPIRWTGGDGQPVVLAGLAAAVAGRKA